MPWYEGEKWPVDYGRNFLTPGDGRSYSLELWRCLRQLLGEQVIPFLHESAFWDLSLHSFISPF